VNGKLAIRVKAGYDNYYLTNCRAQPRDGAGQAHSRPISVILVAESFKVENFEIGGEF
jgi:hypothetical protein